MTASSSKAGISIFSIVFNGFILFSSFYLVSIRPPLLREIGLNASPIYFWTVLGSILAIICMILKPEAVKMNVISLLSAIMIAYLLITQPLVGAQLNATVHLLTNYIFLFIISSFRMSSDTYSNGTYNGTYKVVKLMLFMNASLLIIDTVQRFRTPEDLLYGIFAFIYGDEIFYIYKVDSLLFGDSNAVGFLALSLYTFCTFQARRKIITTYKFLFALMVIFSFSRTAVIGLAFVILSEMICKVSKRLELILVVASLITLFMFTFTPRTLEIIYEPLLGSDRSFQTKIYISEKTGEFFLSQDLAVKLIGIGAGNAMLNPYFQIWTHNLLSTYLIETGLIGTLLFFLINVLILSKIKRLSYRFFTFLYVCGMSFVPHGIPYFYTLIFLNYILNLEPSQRKGELS